MPENRAAWLTAKVFQPLEVREAPYTKSSQGEIVIRTRAVATNPIDYLTQMLPNIVYNWTKYPAIFGRDVAGEVVEVGSGVTRDKPGDRVLGLALAGEKMVKTTAEGGFQNYVVLRENIVSPIPANTSFEAAAVIPLGISTAACALFRKDQLALDPPQHLRAKAKGETVLIWGASTAVGSNAVQLAAAAGYEVFATAGQRNHEYARRLGASQVFDYRDEQVVQKIKAALKGKLLVGATAIGDDSGFACVDIVGASATPAGKRKFVSQMTPSGAPKAPPANALGLIKIGGVFLSAQAATWYKARCNKVACKFVNGGDVVQDELGGTIFRDFLPAALSNGAYFAAPEPMVVGHGLDRIQEAMDIHKTGVSAKKPVVTL